MNAAGMLRAARVAGFSAGAALLTVAPAFAWLGYVATRPRPPRARHVEGRWVSQAAGAAEGATEGAGGGAPWRLAFNGFNMARIEAPDGRVVRGRLVFADDAGEGGGGGGGSGGDTELVSVESLWGAAGAAIGLGAAPVRLEVLAWPAAGAEGDVVAVAAVAPRGVELPEARDLVFVRERAAGR